MSDAVKALTPLFGLTQAELVDYCHSQGQKPFRAKQLFKWIYQKQVLNFDLMSDLSHDFRAHLKATASLTLPGIAQSQCASDGTRKWLIQVGGGNVVATVFITETKRGTLCISSHVGCKLNCQFCSQGKQGFNRALTTA